MKAFIEEHQEPGIGKVRGREIDAEAEVGLVFEDRPQFIERASQYKSGDLADETLGLGERDNRLRPDAVAILIGPSRQGFGAYDPVAAEFDDGLVGNREFTHEDGAFELIGVTLLLAAREQECDGAGNAGGSAGCYVDGEQRAIRPPY